MTLQSITSDFLQLSKAEQELFVQFALGHCSDDMELTTEQKAELDRRIALDTQGKAQYSSWTDVKKRMNKEFGFEL